MFRCLIKRSATVLAACLIIGLTSQALAANRGISIKTTPNETKRRIALVIGNSDYKDDRLKNPVNDSRDIAKLLVRLGFQVTQVENLRQSQMKRVIDEFGRNIRNGGVGFFYFAGHGVQVGGRNFLQPIGAVINTEEDVEYECVDAGRILAKMKAANNLLNIVILDACRNNPYSKWTRSGGNKGLATMNAPKGTIIAYAASPGQQARDGRGRNSPFTESLLKNMDTPGLDAVDCLQRVQREVLKKTTGHQSPWLGLSPLEGDFYFKPGKAGPEKAEAAAPAPPQKQVLVAGGPDSRADERNEKIARLLKEAEALLKAGKLTTPKGANALEKYNEVLFQQPLNQTAGKGLERIAGEYVDWAKARLKAGDLAKAEQFLTRAEKVREGDPRVLALRDELRNAKAGHEQKQRELARAEAARQKAASIVARSSDGRFVKRGNGLITDNRTGLQWVVGPDKNTDAFAAKGWVDKTAMNGGGWRMPTRNELEGIVQKHARAGNPECLPPVFHTSGWKVWSGESNSQNETWALHFGIGEESLSSSYNEDGGRAFAVRLDSGKAPGENKTVKKSAAVKPDAKPAATTPAFTPDFEAGKAAFKMKDFATALKHLRPFAESGNQIAQGALGYCYLHGKAVPKDYRLARVWLQKAAEQGNVYSQILVAAIYANGKGTPVDMVRAYKWCYIAAALGSNDARRALGQLSPKMTPGQITEAKNLATQWRPTKP